MISYEELGLGSNLLKQGSLGGQKVINVDSQLEDGSIEAIKIAAGSTLSSGKTLIDGGSQQTILDRAGVIVAVNGFYTDAGVLQISGGASFTAWTDISSSLSVTFTLPRLTFVYFYHNGVYSITGDASGSIAGEVRMVVDGVQIGSIIILYGGLAGLNSVLYTSKAISHIQRLSEGLHTFKVQWRASGGTFSLAGRTFLDLPAGSAAAQIGAIVV